MSVLVLLSFCTTVSSAKPLTHLIHAVTASMSIVRVPSFIHSQLTRGLATPCILSNDVARTMCEGWDTDSSGVSASVSLRLKTRTILRVCVLRIFGFGVFRSVDFQSLYRLPAKCHAPALLSSQRITSRCHERTREVGIFSKSVLVVGQGVGLPPRVISLPTFLSFDDPNFLPGLSSHLLKPPLIFLIECGDLSLCNYEATTYLPHCLHYTTSRYSPRNPRILNVWDVDSGAGLSLSCLPPPSL